MGDDSVIDYSGNEDWDDNDDFLSEDEQLFLGEAPTDHSNYLYDYYVESIITGITASHNLQKKANLLTEESLKTNFKDSKDVDTDIVLYAQKLLRANNRINAIVMTLYGYCEERKKFWHNCSVDVYKQYFPILKENYLERNSHSETIDFLKSEYLYFFSYELNALNATHNTIALDDRLKMYDYISRLNLTNLEFFKVHQQRKLDFISTEIHMAGYQLEAVKKKNNIKISLIKIPERKPEEEIPDEPLNISNLPSFNLEERFELFRRLGFEKTLIGLDTTKKNKNMLLGLIMGFSVDNAKKLLDGTYKSNLDEEKRKSRKAEIIEKVDDFLYRNEIKL